MITHTWSISRKPLAPEGLAPEEDVHVAPEGVAELMSLLVLVMEKVIIKGVAGSFEAFPRQRR